jgi:hypothetical protein
MPFFFGQAKQSIGEFLVRQNIFLNQGGSKRGGEIKYLDVFAHPWPLIAGPPSSTSIPQPTVRIQGSHSSSRTPSKHNCSRPVSKSTAPTDPNGLINIGSQHGSLDWIDGCRRLTFPPGGLLLSWSV